MLLVLPFVILTAVLAVHANIPRGVHVARRHSRIPAPRAPPQSSSLRKRARKSCNAHVHCAPPLGALQRLISSKTPPKSTSSPHANSSKKKVAAAAPTTKKTTPAAAQAAPTPINNSGTADTIQVVDKRCGPSNASTKTTATTGPNGDIDWLNCGLTTGKSVYSQCLTLFQIALVGSGWNPPEIQMQDIIVKDLRPALKEPGTPLAACGKYIDLFYEFANQTKVQPIMLVAFAMQESGCNPDIVGGGGEQGIMQLSKDKCGNAPNGNCKDPAYNIKTGAMYFARALSDNGGNVLRSVGEYNGWTLGMTQAKATTARYSSCCTCQNNLDYLHQYMNGWIQNIDPYSSNLGKYHNLDVCSDKN
ncbi:lysozyme-like protein [Mycena polygramma]|nr:lysozyme-like protein [Mycena polygramma]